MARMRVSPTLLLLLLLLCASFFLVLLLVTPCASARSLRPHAEGRSLSEENFQSPGDDAVPTSAKSVDYQRKYNEWVHFQAEEVTQDYGGTPAVANPSVPCC